MAIDPATKIKPHGLDTVWTRANKGEPALVVWSDPKVDGLPLKCTEHFPDVWCSELELVLKNNLDAEQLWNTGPGSVMLIPVLPSENIFEKVTLVEVDGGDGMCEILWDGLDRPTEPAFLGFFSPGQGRLALREMLVNQLEVEFASINQCNAPHHGLSAQREWDANAKSTKRGFTDKYHVMKYGKCTHCFRHMLSVGTDDLVPDSAAADAPAFWELAKRGADQRAKEAEIKRLARAGGVRFPRKPPPMKKDSKDFRPEFIPVTRDDKTGEMF